MATREFDTDVLIVGAGPVGLALATELTMRGHTVRVVEKNDRVGVQPRAKTTNIRSMTHMRRWGLAETVRERSPLGPDFPRDVIFRTGLFDAPIYTFKDAFCASPRRYDAFPEHAEFIPQYVVEGILAEHVQNEDNATLSFGAKLVAFEQDDDGVTATIQLQDAALDEVVRARYLVGADGGRSFVRRTLGIEMVGECDILHCATLIMRIPGLEDDPALQKALFHWIINPDAASFIGPMDRGDLWYWSKVTKPDATTDELLEVVRKAIGKDYPTEVVARDDWVIHSLIAERYAQGRVFLAGDACHLHSPFGGHGMNQGIGDAVDLGWKLSAVMRGWGTRGLLESYGIERHQAHKAMVDSSTQNAASLSDAFADPDLMLAGPEGEKARKECSAAVEKLKSPEFRSVGLVLGSHYERSPAIWDESGKPAPVHVSDYSPSARPGCLAPHLWLEDDTSIYDLFSKDYTLLCLEHEDAALAVDFSQIAREAGIPVDVVVLENAEAKALYQAKFVLIRPDQYVAWRGEVLPQNGALDFIMIGLIREDVRLEA